MRELHPITVLAFFDELEKISSSNYTQPKSRDGFLGQMQMGAKEYFSDRRLEKERKKEFLKYRDAGEYSGTYEQFKAETDASRSKAFKSQSEKTIRKINAKNERIASGSKLGRAGEFLSKHKGKFFSAAALGGLLYGYNKLQAKDEDYYDSSASIKNYRSAGY